MPNCPLPRERQAPAAPSPYHQHQRFPARLHPHRARPVPSLPAPCRVSRAPSRPTTTWPRPFRLRTRNTTHIEPKLHHTRKSLHPSPEPQQHHRISLARLAQSVERETLIHLRLSQGCGFDPHVGLNSRSSIGLSFCLFFFLFLLVLGWEPFLSHFCFFCSLFCFWAVWDGLSTTAMIVCLFLAHLFLTE